MTATISPSAQRLVAAIEAGSISVDDLKKLRAAIAEREPARSGYPEDDSPLLRPPSGDQRGSPMRARRVPDEIFRKYQVYGADAVERAALFAAEWDELHTRGMRVPRDQFIAINLERVLGVAIK